MLWTDDAVEVLKRLANEGRSASVIAAALGVASRNAVIGKANRIGIKLNGDGRATIAAGTQAGAQGVSAAAGQSRSTTALPRAPSMKAAWTFAGAEIGEMRRLGFADIRAAHCRWPLGDPGQADFAYCGLPPAPGRSYCAGHCRLAYQAPNGGSRRGRREPPRSWAPTNALRLR